MSSLDYYIRKLIAEAGMEADRRARDMTIDIASFHSREIISEARQEAEQLFSKPKVT